MSEIHEPNEPVARTRRRYRPRVSTSRGYRLTPRFSDEELDAIRDAAEAADMTLTGFCALAALAVARRQFAAAPSGPSRDELADLQRQLFAARVAVNRVGVNLNQAVAELNTTGAAPVWLKQAVARSVRAVEELDVVVSLIHRQLA